MDSLITAAARSLASGDPLGALKRVALRDDPPALALRGIAMAQLGDFDRARGLLRSAARAFGSKEALARARCVLAEAEIALACRELDWSEKALAAAGVTLAAHGDRVNAAHARYLQIRRLLLIGRLPDADRLLTALDPATLPAPLRVAHHLIVAGMALRRLQTRAARDAFDHAARDAQRSDIPALIAEVQSAAMALQEPAARLIEGGTERLLRLDEVEQLFAANVLVIDACRYAVRDPRATVSLARRPVLFTLVRALAESWPADTPRQTLITRAFRVRSADDSFRARLRVEIGRLRKALEDLAGIDATANGFILTPQHARQIVLLARPVDDEHAAALAMLSDGESWSSSALALALGASQRTVQRELEALAAVGKVQSYGRGRARRWTSAPIGGFTTTLLLPGPLPGA